ncbi:DNA transfer protein p32 [Burkholderia multivorans]|uniref:DNA transfer protein p32 n=2 Tax=Burkholderia multivorans TaxID=87883 RepID=UPI00112052C8|nr:DNA transfer protein p32 [Burkholderia multivorans]
MQKNLQPYMQLGSDSISQLQSMLGSGALSPQFSFNPTEAQLEQTPGYQFTLQQGMKNLNNQLAAKGLNLSGAQAKGLANYTTGLADQTYQQQYQNALQNFMTNYGVQADQYNRLAGLVGLGQNAAAGVGNAGLQTATNAGNFLTSGANAQAAGTVAGANALGSGLSSLGSAGMLYSMMNPSAASGSSFYSPMFTSGLGANYGFQAPAGLSAFGYGA